MTKGVVMETSVNFVSSNKTQSRKPVQTTERKEQKYKEKESLKRTKNLHHFATQSSNIFYIL
jgi:hypothetical protein